MGWFQGGWGGSKTQGWMRTVLAGLRPQDVFATSLYTGTGAAQKIITPFAPDFAWRKNRTATSGHLLQDTVRGQFLLDSSTTATETSTTSSFDQTGITVTSTSGNNHAVWIAKRAPKFFDIVVYTGDGTTGRQIAHGLGIKPGMIIVKRRDATVNWFAYHTILGAASQLVLNATTAAAGSTQFASTEPDAASFTVSANSNTSGGTFIAYLFAHDPDATNGVIQCGAGNVMLPWVPQWVLFKDAGATGNWFIEDSARGFAASGTTPSLNPNLTAAEGTSGALFVSGSTLTFNGLTNPVWCAIRAPV